MSDMLIHGKPVHAQHRCLPCGRDVWDKVPDTTYYIRPVCCGKAMLPTGRVENDGALLSIVPSYKQAA